MTKLPDHPPCKEAALTAFKKHDGMLTKILRLNGDGSLHKDSTQCYLDSGVCMSGEVSNVYELRETLDSLGYSMAVAYGVTSQRDFKKVVSRRLTRHNPDAITRTRDNFDYPSPAVFMSDYDPALGSEPLSPNELYKLLIEAMPELAHVDMLWRPSASSCIFHGDEEVVGISGQRFYFIVDHGEQIPMIGELIAKRLWLNGHGRIDLSTSGSMLERCTIDTCVWQPERLDFAAGAFCEPPLERRPVPGKIYEGKTHA